MMLVLKIPLVYLGFVVWYEIKAEPVPGLLLVSRGVQLPRALAPSGYLLY